jgi:hypothetical protein
MYVRLGETGCLDLLCRDFTLITWATSFSDTLVQFCQPTHRYIIFEFILGCLDFKGEL